MDYFNNITLNDALIDVLDIAVRSLMTIIILFILTKWMGNKQIAQLSFFDYVVGITLGSIGAELASGIDSPYHFTVIAMTIFAAVSVFISWLVLKSIRARRLFVGTPTTLIKEGKILLPELMKTKVDVNELLSECRIAGYFDISDIYYCIMETNGQFSFIPVSDAKPVTAKDMKLETEQDELLANVIINGKVMEENLETLGVSKDTLSTLLEDKKVNVKEIILAVMDKDKQLKVFCENGIKNYNIFE